MVVMGYQVLPPEYSMRKLEYDITAHWILPTRPHLFGPKESAIWLFNTACVVPSGPGPLCAS